MGGITQCKACEVNTNSTKDQKDKMDEDRMKNRMDS